MSANTPATNSSDRSSRSSLTLARASACAFRVAVTPAKSKMSSGKYADASALTDADPEPRRDALTPSVSLASTAPSKRACRSNPALRPRVVSAVKLAAARSRPLPVAVGPSRLKILTAPAAPSATMAMIVFGGRYQRVGEGPERRYYALDIFHGVAKRHLQDLLPKPTHTGFWPRRQDPAMAEQCRGKVTDRRPRAPTVHHCLFFESSCASSGSTPLRASRTHSAMTSRVARPSIGWPPKHFHAGEVTGGITVFLTDGDRAEAVWRSRRDRGNAGAHV